jgi:hypothetical protein
MRKTFWAAAATLAAVAGTAVQAQSITPSTFSGSLAVGGSVTIHKMITLPPSGANLVDIMFMADNTGSMGGVIGSVQSDASDILSNLPAGPSYDFAVSRYLGDPAEGEPASYAVNSPLTSSTVATTTGINAWFASGGGDYPEGTLYALQQAATTTAWRAGSERLLLYFGDAPGHTETTDLAGAISALTSNGVTALAFNNAATGNGMDGCYFGGAGIDGGACDGSDDGHTHQASAVTSATGGVLTDIEGKSAADLEAVVNSEISTAVSSLNLSFGSDLVGSGLTLTFTCTDVLGCNNVGGGDTRSFDLTITANTAGVYDFSTFANGVDAKELDHIVVGSVSGVPEPSTWALMSTGLIGLGGIARRRKNQQKA